MTTYKHHKPKLVPLSRRCVHIPVKDRKKERRDLLMCYAAAIVLGIFGSLISVKRILPQRYIDGPLYATTARVEQKLMVTKDSRSNAEYPSGQLMFRIHGQLVTLETLDLPKWTDTRVGDTIPITYREDTSGNIYIDDWRPAPQQENR